MKNEKNEDFEESNHYKITIGTTTVNELRERGLTLEINQDTVEPSSKERINILGPS